MVEVEVEVDVGVEELPGREIDMTGGGMVVIGRRKGPRRRIVAGNCRVHTAGTVKQTAAAWV